MNKYMFTAKISALIILAFQTAAFAGGAVPKVVPEPISMTLFAIGGGVLGARLLRKKK
jgi:hypothetical protein